MANQIKQKEQNKDTVTVLPDNKNIKYMGLWDFTDPLAPVCSYGASCIEIMFEGTGCIAMYGSSGADFQYRIDGNEWVLLPATDEKEHLLAEGLGNGAHSLVLARRSQCIAGNTVFMGFKPADNGSFKLLKRPVDKALRIEFIGDSITAGCLNEYDPSLPLEKSAAIENAFNAFGPVTARMLNADWDCIAIGGAGLHHNWLEEKPGTQAHMQEYFLSTLYSPLNKKRGFGSRRPNCVVVALGTNDFGSKPFPEKAQYREIYGSYIRSIRDRYPEASIFCLTPWAFTKGARTPFDDCRDEIGKAVRAMDDKNTFSVDTVNGPGGPWLDREGDFAGDWTHPVVGGHEKIALRLSEIIKSKMRLKERP